MHMEIMRHANSMGLGRTTLCQGCRPQKITVATSTHLYIVVKNVHCQLTRLVQYIFRLIWDGRPFRVIGSSQQIRILRRIHYHAFAGAKLLVPAAFGKSDTEEVENMEIVVGGGLACWQ